MSLKPYRNSKGVDKPFRSPFSGLRRNNVKDEKGTPQSSLDKTPTAATSSRKLVFRNTPGKRKASELEGSEDEKPGKCKKLEQSDLETLRERVRKKREHIADIKRGLIYKKKNKAEDLNAAIEKWTVVCQKALQEYSEILKDNSSCPPTMYQLLSKFGINPKLVRYSVEDDTFS